LQYIKPTSALSLLKPNTEEQTSFVKQAADKAFKSEKLNKIENG
jgi:hypothetical protein